jgi:hypothetical protein
VAAAIYAYEANNNAVEREIGFVPDSAGNEIAHYPNKHLMLQALTTDLITEDHKQKAVEYISYIGQHVMMALVSSYKVTPFVQSLYEQISKADVSHNNFGVLAWMPKTIDNLKRQDNVKHELALCRKSDYVGKVNEWHFVDKFTVIYARFIRHAECFVVMGRDENHNMISYWASKEDRIYDGARIKGKVKKQIVSDQYGGKVTQLHYVRLLGNKNEREVSPG